MSKKLVVITLIMMAFFSGKTYAANCPDIDESPMGEAKQFPKNHKEIKISTTLKSLESSNSYTITCYAYTDSDGEPYVKITSGNETQGYSKTLLSLSILKNDISGACRVTPKALTVLPYPNFSNGTVKSVCW